jgi:hypothetical protein
MLLRRFVGISAQLSHTIRYVRHIFCHVGESRLLFYTRILEGSELNLCKSTNKKPRSLFTCALSYRISLLSVPADLTSTVRMDRGILTWLQVSPTFHVFLVEYLTVLILLPVWCTTLSCTTS